MSGFVSWEELKALPRQEWLIRDQLPTGAQALLYGPSGQGKSFVAMDWALCVATGHPWLRKYPVKRGAVVYIACEGAAGLPKRVAAWLETHEVKDEDLHNILFKLYALDVYDEYKVEEFFLDFQSRFPTQTIHDPETGGLVETVAETEELRLVVVDTLARVYRGENENDASQMTVFLSKLEKVVSGYGATLLYVHHSGKTGDAERGSTALRAAMETVHQCKGTRTKTVRPDGTSANLLTDIILTNNKQKDDIEGALHLKVHRVELDTLPVDDAGNPQTSLVLELAPPRTDADPEPVTRKQQAMRAKDMIRLLAGTDGGLTFREWMLASGLDKDAFKYRLKALERDGLVQKSPAGKWTPVVLDDDDEEAE